MTVGSAIVGEQGDCRMWWLGKDVCRYNDNLLHKDGYLNVNVLLELWYNLPSLYSLP